MIFISKQKIFECQNWTTEVLAPSSDFRDCTTGEQINPIAGIKKLDKNEFLFQTRDPNFVNTISKQISKGGISFIDLTSFNED